GPTSALLWTRYIGPDDRPVLRAEIAADESFTTVLQQREVSANGASDGCAKVVMTGLRPGQIYYYRFVAPGGALSPVGRTRTLPKGAVAQYKVAVFSCSNIGFGWFNAYGHAARRDDLDLVIHVGDYLYEYPRGEYPSAAQTVPGRQVEPAGELLTVADYRTRYALYRSDPDLQELHRLFPWVAIWDDHELANDAWVAGAENHDPNTEGDWFARKAAAKQAHNEWLQVTGKPYQRYDIGDLLSLITLDTRVEGRDKQLDMFAAVKGAPDPKAALVAFRDGPWSDPKRSLLGPVQEQWIADQLKSSVKSGRKWQLVAQQIVMGGLLLPPASAGWLAPDADKRAASFVKVGVLAGSINLPLSMDSWEGYSAARTRFYKAAQAANANLVVVSGDSHNAWANDLTLTGKPVGVEFAGHSVTSPGFESVLGIAPAKAAADLVAFNPGLKWCELSQRGYLTVTLTPDSARSDWVFMDTVREKSLASSSGKGATVERGANKMVLV
ncbi:MAG: alkaline phosphatase D family protein, partial [Polymorphobacter sp.]